jgi:hypothetical protein
LSEALVVRFGAEGHDCARVRCSTGGTGYHASRRSRRHLAAESALHDAIARLLTGVDAVVVSGTPGARARLLRALGRVARDERVPPARGPIAMPSESQLLARGRAWFEGPHPD